MDELETVDILEDEELNHTEEKKDDKFDEKLNNALNNFINNNMLDKNINKKKEEPKPGEIGRVIDIGSDNILIKITSDIPHERNLIDQYVLFISENNLKIVGSVIKINETEASIKLIGEIRNDKFIPGVLTKPAIDSICFIANEEDTKLIVVDERSLCFN